MAMSNNTTTTGASAFFASLFAGGLPIAHPEAEITDWEFVNDSDVSDDDFVDVISDDESVKSSIILSVYGAKEDEEFESGVSALAVVGIITSLGGVADRESRDPAEEEAEEEDAEDYNDRDDLDDELVPWSVSDRFGRERMRKLGNRAYAKMNKTKKFAYALNRPGCVRGKHGLGRKG
ncbi:hypothetical protein QQ045_014744 [Rhodiola kirilowii]